MHEQDSLERSAAFNHAFGMNGKQQAPLPTRGSKRPYPPERF